MTIFIQMLKSQWRWAWAAVLLCGVAAFAIPIVSVQQTLVESQAAGNDLFQDQSAVRFLSTMERWGGLYTAVSALAGLALAMLAWSHDHRGRHIYALVLPIERWRYVLYRYANGALLLLVPAVALLIGGLLAVSNTAIPAGLSAYAPALAFRFALASIVAYSLFFAISSGTTRTAAIVLAPIVALFAIDATTAAFGLRLGLAENAGQALFEWPGVFEVFTGRWMLVDV